MSRTRAIPLEDRPAPNPEATPGLPDLGDLRSQGPYELPEVLTLGECAHLTGYRVPTIRDAIKRGELPGFIPRGREPGRTGPGNGYRVYRADLQRWFFGGVGVEKKS